MKNKKPLWTRIFLVAIAVVMLGGIVFSAAVSLMMA